MSALVIVLTGVVRYDQHRAAALVHGEGDPSPLTPAGSGRVRSPRDAVRSELLPLTLELCRLSIVGGAKPSHRFAQLSGRGMRLVAVAGAVANLLLAGVCYWLNFIFGCGLTALADEPRKHKISSR